MRKKTSPVQNLKKYLTIPAAILTFTFATARPASAEIVARIVATVNQDAITSYDFDQALQTIRQDLSASKTQDASVRDLRQKTMNHLINQSLIDHEIIRLGIEVSEEDVTKAVQNIAARNKITMEILRKVLAARGQSLDDFRSNIREQLKRMRFITQTVGQKVKVSETEVEELYAKKTEGRKNPPALDEKLRNELRNEVYDTKVQEAMRKHMETLKEKAKIDIRLS